MTHLVTPAKPWHVSCLFLVGSQFPMLHLLKPPLFRISTYSTYLCPICPHLFFRIPSISWSSHFFFCPCGSLDKNGPCRRLCLNAWSPVAGTVWEGLPFWWPFWKRHVTGNGLCNVKSPCRPHSLSLAPFWGSDVALSYCSSDMPVCYFHTPQPDDCGPILWHRKRAPDSIRCFRSCLGHVASPCNRAVTKAVPWVLSHFIPCVSRIYSTREPPLTSHNLNTSPCKILPLFLLQSPLLFLLALL